MTYKLRVVWSSVWKEDDRYDSKDCSSIVEVKEGTTIGEFLSTLEVTTGREISNGFCLR